MRFSYFTHYFPVHGGIFYEIISDHYKKRHLNFSIFNTTTLNTAVYEN